MTDHKASGPDQHVPDPLRGEVRGDVLVLWLDAPLSRASVAALSAALAGADPALAGVVLTAHVAFLPLAEVDLLAQLPALGLPELALAVERFARPVVAALPAEVQGPGLELALAAHLRVALPGARLSLPCLSVGLPPGAGGSQRLPRLVGAEPALRLMMQGRPLGGTEALVIGLVDHVVEEGLVDRAVALVQGLAGATLPRSCDRREGLRDARGYQAAVTRARAEARAQRLPAAARLVDCIEAAQLLPFDQALAFERAAYDEACASPESRGLRHAFAAERVAFRPPAALAGQALPEIKTLGLWGTGGPAAEVAEQALSRGLRVVLAGPDRAALAPCLQRIAARQEARVQQGQLSPAARDADWARLTIAASGADLSACTVILCDPALVPDGPADGPPDGVPCVTLSGPAPGGVALWPGPVTGALSEVVAAPGAAALAVAHGLARRLGGRVLACGPAGPVTARLRAQLGRVVALLEASGVERVAIGAALAAFGIGAGGNARPPAAPAGAGDVVPAVLAAMACEGLRLLEEGTAETAAAVDAAANLSGLFPRWEGGPLHHATQRGLMALRADLRRRADSAPAIFSPPALLDRLIAVGQGV